MLSDALKKTIKNLSNEDKVLLLDYLYKVIYWHSYSADKDEHSDMYLLPKTKLKEKGQSS